MTVFARIARLAAAGPRHWGESVTLASGTVITAEIGNQYQSPLDGLVELAEPVRMDQQPAPQVVALVADVASVAVDDVLTFRGERWRVTRIDDELEGTMRRLTTVRAADVDADNVLRRWR